MEAFIRNKYEKKQYIKKGAPPPKTNSTQDKLPTAPQREAKIEKIERVSPCNFSNVLQII